MLVVHEDKGRILKDAAVALVRYLFDYEFSDMPYTDE